MKVLVIDDDNVSRKSISRMLIDIHEVETAVSGDDGLSRVTTWRPDVILLDVEMPGKNGYEVCDLLKQSQATRDIPVLFLSGRSSLRERLQGYEAGGDDYLVKPCAKDELKAKLLRLEALHNAKHNLTEKINDASRAALEAMTTSAELGRAIRFVMTTYECTTHEELARELLALLQDFHLKGTAMFAIKGDMRFFTQGQDETPPLESSLIAQLHNQKRFYDFGCRTLVSYPSVGLLVKNMPLDDRERYGRIKDVLPFALSATDAKIRVITTEMGLKQQADQLSRSVDTVRQTLEALSEAISSNHDSVSSKIRQLTDELDQALPTMGLEEDQERFIVNRIDATFCDISALIDKSETLKTSLAGIIRLLQQLALQQRHLLHHDANDTADKPDQVEDSDIELF